MIDTPEYQQITDCTEEYFRRKGDSPLGMGWPNSADAIRRYDVMLDVIRPTSECVRLLDFGCGTGHLFEHIAQGNTVTNIDYHGVDLSPTFIHSALAKHPTVRFTHADVFQTPDILTEYDYAIINGVFTSKVGMSHSTMFNFVKNVLTLLFSKVRIGIAFNAMSKHVDWERDDLFHLPMDEIAAFLCSNLSRNFVIRNDYGLYEFATYVYC